MSDDRTALARDAAAAILGLPVERVTVGVRGVRGRPWSAVTVEDARLAVEAHATREEAAKALGITAPTLRRILSGATKNGVKSRTYATSRK